LAYLLAATRATGGAWPPGRAGPWAAEIRRHAGASRADRRAARLRSGVFHPRRGRLQWLCWDCWWGPAWWTAASWCTLPGRSWRWR